MTFWGWGPRYNRLRHTGQGKSTYFFHPSMLTSQHTSLPSFRVPPAHSCLSESTGHRPETPTLAHGKGR